jgi:hypothetical protein
MHRRPHGHASRAIRLRKSSKNRQSCDVSQSNTLQLTFPDLPETTKVMYLSAEEKKFALARLPPKKLDSHNIGFKSLAKRVLMSPTM